jgi:hypothetical protein
LSTTTERTWRDRAVRLADAVEAEAMAERQMNLCPVSDYRKMQRKWQAASLELSKAIVACREADHPPAA